MKVTTLLNEKGGVGKTTLATHMAAGMAILGHRVLLIDADPQGNATRAFGLKKTPGLYNLLVRSEEYHWRDVLKSIPAERYIVPDEAPRVEGFLVVVPSNLETRTISLSVSDGLILLKRLQEMRGGVDYVFIDTSPTPSLLQATIFMASDYIVAPTKLEQWSLEGLAESIQHQSQYAPLREQYNLPPTETIGIVPTMTRLKTLEHSENLERLRKHYGELVWNPIPIRTIWAEAASNRRSIFATAPESAAAQDAWFVVERFTECLNERT